MIERLHVKVSLLDRDSNTGAVTVSLPFDTDIETAMAFGITLAGRLLGLSNAVVHEVKVTYRSHEASLTADPSISRAQEGLLVFYRNDADVINTISIPCARNDIWLTDGPYRDEIINTAMFEYAVIVGLAEDVASACIYPDGAPLPSEFITIARAE